MPLVLAWLAIAFLIGLLTLAFLLLLFALLVLTLLSRAFSTVRAVLARVRLIGLIAATALLAALLAATTRLVLLLFPVFVLLHVASFRCSVRRYADI
ncbi:MAG TPA: hypothetical protein VLQ46_14315 [Casimicrobiaceae bacterium]|nr:hypothetical protein [Casimicrobiaceae bacterium]